MPDITLVVVNYLSASLTRAAVESARSSTRASLRVIVVDNSTDPVEAAGLQASGADEVIVAPDNLGYAGGANLGVASATTPVVVVSNPDVVFGEGCLDRLAAEIRGDVAVAGPLFHWDSAGQWLLPPADVLGLREKISQVVASRMRVAARRRDRARTRRRIDFWRRSATGSVPAVSGAVMAMDRGRLESVGGFDTAYELYFEEIDLARRLSRRGSETVYVPSAHCRHLYNQSAALDPRSRAKHDRSERTYLRRWAPLALALGPLVSRAWTPEDPAIPILAPTDSIQLPSSDREWLVELSPFPSFDSAVGRFTSDSRVTIPAEVWSAWREPSLQVRVVDPVSVEVVRRAVIRG